MLDLQSSIYFSRTDKRNHEIFKYYLLEIYMDNIIIYMCENRLKNKNYNFESIFYLYIYHIKNRGFNINGYFNKYLNSYEFEIFIYKNKFYIWHNIGGIFIHFNDNKLCYINHELCKFNDILEIIDKIYNLKNTKYEYDTNNLFNYIKKDIKIINHYLKWEQIEYNRNIFYNKMKKIKDK